ncbi:hypothetical protein [Herpetosiphon giganteus]|uniref:hypothetical protein n=1 Tax=Herpetosiphon giganteus TaxID=2029754 RepID=UPI00195D0041|nr:hypothetical protein [Herpetosiphon giganteus]MBM7845593.1 hypothetical protein [Herpetosiphon giganteus]
MSSLFALLPEAHRFWHAFTRLRRFPLLSQEEWDDPFITAVAAATAMHSPNRLMSQTVFVGMLPVVEAMQAAITSHRNPDDSITQTLSADAMKQALITMHQRSRAGLFSAQPTAHDQILTAIMLHGLACPDAPWVVADTHVSRTLAATNPFRGRPHTLHHRMLDLPSKETVPVVAWCVLPPNLLPTGSDIPTIGALTVVGSSAKCAAAWASILDGSRHAITLPQVPLTPFLALGGDLPYHQIGKQVAHKAAGTQQYRTLRNETPLPSSRLATTTILHRSVLTPQAGEDCLHLTGMDGLPNHAILWAQLERACPLPLQPHWLDDLWHVGRTHGLIVQLPAWGCAGYWLKTSAIADWARIIRAIVTKSPVTTAGVAVTTIGKKSAAAEKAAAR